VKTTELAGRNVRQRSFGRGRAGKLPGLGGVHNRRAARHAGVPTLAPAMVNAIFAASGNRLCSLPLDLPSLKAV